MAASVGLHELIQQIVSVAYNIWRKRWYMLITAWVISLLGWFFVLSMPYRYQSYARIFVDADTSLPSVARDLGIDVDVGQRVEVVRSTLTTAQNLERIIQGVDGLSRLAVTAAQRERMVAYLRDNIRVTAPEGGLFRIEFEIDDPRLSDRQRADISRQVVVYLVSFFIEQNSEDGRQQIDIAEGFVADNVTEYLARLEESERRHAQFKQDNLEFLGGQGSFLSRLEAARENLKRTQNDISELNATIAALEDQRSSVPPKLREPVSSRTGAGGAAKDPLELRIAELEKRYDDFKSIGYTEQHPDVVNVLRQVETLKAQFEKKQAAVEKELKEAAVAGSKSNLTVEVPNKLYEQLTLDLINKRTEIAALEKRRDDQQSLIVQMEVKAKRVPEIEAEEQRLSRDYNTIRQQYNELVNKKQDLELQRSVESADEAVILRVVEEPKTPTGPSGPQRLTFLVTVLVGAIAIGIGVALMLSQLRPVVITVDQLRNSFDLPILGNVTRTLSEEEGRRKNIEMVGFAGMCVLLFVTFIVLFIADIVASPTLG